MNSKAFNLEEFLAIFLRRKLLLILPMLIILPTVYFVDSRRTPKYTAYTVFEVVAPNYGVANGLGADLAFFSSMQSFHKTLYLVNSLEFLTSAHIAYKKRIEALYPDEKQAKKLIVSDVGSMGEGLNIDAVKTTNLMRLSLIDSHPVRCAERVNSITETLREYSKNVATSNLSDVRTLLEKQLASLSKELRTMETMIKDFKSRSHVISVSSEQQSIAINIQSSRNQITASELKLQEIEAELTTLVTSAFDTGRGILDNPAYRDVRNHLLKLEAELGTLLSQFTDEHPLVKAKKRETTTVRTHLRSLEIQNEKDYRNSDKYLKRKRSLAGQVDILKQRIVSLNKNLVAEREKLAELPVTEQHLSDMERKRGVLEGLYIDTSHKFREVQVAILSKESDIKILEMANPPSKPFSPKTQRDLMYAFWAALALGVLVVFIAEHISKPLNTPGELEELLGLKNLGNINKIYPTMYEKSEINEDCDEKLVAFHEPQSLLNDSYRKIRTNLMTIGFGEDKATLLITSSISGEGKSLTAANLAINFANVGKKTLIIDCDLRTPHQDIMFAKPGNKGLLQALQSDAPIEDYIQPTSIANLWFLAAGQKYRNFVEALSSPKLEQIMVNLRYAYDIVIIDTPPLDLVADGLLLAPLADGVVLMVGLCHVSSPSVKRSLEALINVDAKVTGVVANLHNATRSLGSYGAYGRYGKYAKYSKYAIQGDYTD